MPEPKKITAAEKLITMEQMLQSRLANGYPPSDRVNVALQSFQTAPTKEEIERVASDLMQTSAADALEFKVYAETMAAPTNARRDSAQRLYDSGAAPLPVVEQALKSFKTPPTPEQVQALGDYLRATHGPDAGQQFESYAANMVAERSGQLPPSARPDAVTSPARPQNFAGLEQTARVVQAAKAREETAKMQQAGALEPGLVQDAKDVLQGTGHILTLGAIPAPPGIKEGNDRLLEKVGLGPKKPRQGKTEAPRDLNKERDLLNKAKEIHE
jgi:hypothetical protein